jgi:hypothetical protein
VLTWMETLNVHANHHATDGLHLMGAPSTLTTLIPLSNNALQINQTYITAKYTTHLRKAPTAPAMLKRVQKHYAWDATYFYSIDWQVHHGAKQKLV